MDETRTVEQNINRVDETMQECDPDKAAEENLQGSQGHIKFLSDLSENHSVYIFPLKFYSINPMYKLLYYVFILTPVHSLQQ